MIYGRAGAIGKVWNGTGYITVKGAEDVQWLEGGVCFRGASSVIEKCGGISSTNFTMAYYDDFGHYWNYSAYCIGAGTSLKGDSGAAAYKYTSASEINAKGIITSKVAYDDGQIDACGTTISTVLSSTGTTLVKG
jgi:hypothetical protein